MRLFLASEELGEHADTLLELAGEGRKVLFITNAHDYYEPERRVEYVDRKSRCLIDAGFEVTELDLRKYFGKAEELKAFVDDYAPDVVFSIGGNVFLLRTAMKLSGMDEIIKEGVANDRFVYGGYSAGSMVASRNIRYYGHDYLVPEAVPGIYGVEAVLDGLGLFDEYIVPHADVEKHAGITKMYKDKIEKDGNVVYTLNQSSVLVVSGEKKELLP